MVFQDECAMIVEPIDSSQIAVLEKKPASPVPQRFHSSCSHCDLSCLKGISPSVSQLTHEADAPKHSAAGSFEAQRLNFYTIIDEWRADRVDHISFIYQKKRNQVDLICSQIFHEYEIFRIEQKNFFNEHLLAHQKLTYPTFIPNEIEELNQKLSLTRHLLDYFIQPKLSHLRPFADKEDDEYVNYENVFKSKPVHEYPLSTDNLAMASSPTHLLLRDGAHLLLYDEKEKVHQLEIKVQHPGDFIRDICWCEALGCYLVLTQYLLFLYDPDKYTLTIVDKIKPIERKKFSSITCSDNIMFLVNKNGECIERWSIAKSFNWKLIKRKARPPLCRSPLTFVVSRLASGRVLR